MKIGIAISGGGSKGAFNVGVVNALRTLLNPDFSIVSGTSTGSLIGTLIATRQFQLMNAVYSGVNTEDIVTSRHKLFGIDLGVELSLLISAIAGSESVFTTEGLQGIIDRNIPNFQKVKDSQSLLLYTATELQSGMSRVFDNRTLDPQELRNALVASANQPTLMEPIKIQGKQYVDGGVTEYLPLSAIFKREESQDLDLIISTTSSPLEPEYVQEDYTSSLDILGRTLEIFGAEIASGDLIAARAINIARKLYRHVCTENYTKWSQADAKNILTEEEESWIEGKKSIPVIHINPTRHITEMTSLDFDPDKMSALIKEGELTTRDVLRNQGIIIME